MGEPVLTQQQIKDLAKPIVGMARMIGSYYEKAENEKAFQEWYKLKYGHAAPEEV
jgi:hypothetical protein